MDFKSHIEKNYSSHEVRQMRAEARLFIEGLHSLQDSIRSEVRRIMETEQLSFSDLSERLGITPRMVSKLIKGGSVNFDTITKLSLLNGKIPFISWKNASGE
ncbi:MAG: helix-turn-helix domain-containing protein [Deltaproteobacteria bacterium]|nr:helix-turn-helix domain-containing protein [Deltaproteobacteria bacterium]